MGRPEDEFVRKHAEKSENGWKCKYCSREFKKTSVSRMRVHLSGRGDSNISGCEEVPNEIADEALEKINKKRARKSSEGDSVIVATSRGKSVDHFTQRGHEEHFTDALLKFLMLTKNTIAVSDFIKDRNLREFLERVHRYGVPSGLLTGENLVVEKSLLNIRDVVSKYMLEVMESWKITGCTLIGFNPKDMKLKSSDPGKGKFAVLGFYSPKGFIFFEGPHITTSTSYFRCIPLKIYLPTLDIDDVKVHAVNHLCEQVCEGNLSTCEFSDTEISRWISNLSYTEVSSRTIKCVCNTMQDICIDVCKKLEWAQKLIKRAENMHLCLANNSYEYHREYYKALKKINFTGFIGGKHASPIACFLAFMTFGRDELEKFVPHSFDMSFPDDSNFWFKGNILNSVLSYLLKAIPDKMDTLVPTAGFCWQKIMDVHFAVSDDIPDDFQKALKSELRDNYACLYTAAFLNPCYFKTVDEGERLNLIEAVKQDWLLLNDLGRMEEFAHEVERYNSRIHKSKSLVFYLGKHPVKWWQQNGNAYPLLHKYAIQVLSRPVSCMRNQVKKHIVHLEGAEDYILRLNVRMMEEYKSLGDNIYEHIDF